MGTPSGHSSLFCSQECGFGSHGSDTTVVEGVAQVVCISEEKSAAEGADIVVADCTSHEGSSAGNAEFIVDSLADSGVGSIAVDCTSIEGSSTGRRTKGAKGDTREESSFVCGEQAGGSCGAHRVFDVMLVKSGLKDRETSGSGGKMKNSKMVRRVVRARRRQYRARHMRGCRGVYAWKAASAEVMRHLLALVQCVSVLADVPRTVMPAVVFACAVGVEIKVSSGIG